MLLVHNLIGADYHYSASSDDSELVYTKYVIEPDAELIYMIFFNYSDNFLSLKAKLYHVHINKNINSELELIHSASGIFAIDAIVNDDVAESYINCVNQIIPMVKK